MSESAIPPSTPPSQNSESFFVKYALVIKGVFIFFLILILQIPALLIDSLVDERKNRQTEVTNEVASMWGGRQKLMGPVISVPYTSLVEKEVRDANNNSVVRKFSETETAFFDLLPSKVKADVVCRTDKKHRGIFDISIYKAEININAVYLLDNIKSESIKSSLNSGAGYLTMGFSDLNGFDAGTVFMNDKELKIEGGTKATLFNNNRNGVFSEFQFDPLQNRLECKITLSLKGTERIEYIPVAQNNEVTISGSWGSPSYMGISPDTDERQNMQDAEGKEKPGFKAAWNYNNLLQNFNTDYTAVDYYTYNSFDRAATEQGDSRNLGVKFFIPIDGYQKTTRSLKYNLLIIALTFIAFVFLEIANKNKRRIHVFHYTLIGLALLLFYSLLLSFSEHLSFNLAYLIAGAMIVILVSMFVKGILKENKAALISFGVMLFSYSYIYVLLQLEDFALLAGSIGLFVILAVIMYFSRNTSNAAQTE